MDNGDNIDHIQTGWINCTKCWPKKGEHCKKRDENGKYRKSKTGKTWKLEMGKVRKLKMKRIES